MKILIIGPAWIGDTVMAQALFIWLKKRHPGSEIDVLAPVWMKPLLDCMPEIHGLLDSPFNHGELRLGDRYRLGVSLRERHYEQAIVLSNSYKSALVPYFAKILRRTGWIGEMRYGLLNDVRWLNKRHFPKMIQRFVALGLEKSEPLPIELPYPQLQISVSSVDATLNRFSLSKPDKLILALCPGSGFGPSKQWPADYYADIAKAKLSEGWRVWLFGSAKDKIIADLIVTATEYQVENLSGMTKLSEAIDLLSLASLVVTNDSGLMHVAAALGRSLVVIYGSTSPEFTPPLSKKAQILKSTLPCSPCFKRTCLYKHHHCMKKLKPEQVLEAAATIFSS